MLQTRCTVTVVQTTHQRSKVKAIVTYDNLLVIGQRTRSQQNFVNTRSNVKVTIDFVNNLV